MITRTPNVVSVQQVVVVDPALRVRLACRFVMRHFRKKESGLVGGLVNLSGSKMLIQFQGVKPVNQHPTPGTIAINET